MSINQIARVMRRSTQTVYRYVRYVGISNRRLSPSTRRHLHRHFVGNIKQLQLRMKMFMKGLCDFADAVQCGTVPMVTVDWFLRCENTPEEEGEDPA
jgi:hypothetical protein